VTFSGNQSSSQATRGAVNRARSGPLAALVERGRTAPDQTALIAADEAWSVGALLARTDRLAAGLAARGVGRRDRVAVHLHNRPEAVLTYLACLRLGAIAVPLNARSAAPELIDLVQRTQPVIYLGERDLYPTFAPVPVQQVSDRARFLIDASATDSGAASWEELVGGDTAPPDPLVSLEEPAILLTTSGTTGPSKIVVWSHRTLANISLSAPGRSVVEGGVLPLLSPLMHGSGIYFVLNALTQRALAVVLPQFEPGAVLDAMQRHRVTSIAGMPFMCQALVREQRRQPREVGSLQAATVMGDTCPVQIETDFQAVFGVPLRSFWAATEDVGATVADGRVGPYMRVLERATVRVVDAEDRPVRTGEVGELVVSSPTTSPGYWQGPDNVAPLPRGQFRSGDLVREVSPRLLEYVARQKDLIVRGGSNISPTDVEEALRAHPDVVDAGVAGLPDPQLGERVGALLVLDSATSRDSVSDVLAWLEQRIAKYKVPEVVALVDAIPRNALTKIDRAAVVETLRARAGGLLTGGELRTLKVMGRAIADDPGAYDALMDGCTER
jgi:long-chain acyl-CoA synthetase